MSSNCRGYDRDWMPVYWKPRHATRSMQHRAWAKRSLARERELARLRGPSLVVRLRAWLAARMRG